MSKDHINTVSTYLGFGTNPITIPKIVCAMCTNTVKMAL